MFYLFSFVVTCVLLVFICVHLCSYLCGAFDWISGTAHSLTVRFRVVHVTDLFQPLSFSSSVIRPVFMLVALNIRRIIRPDGYNSSVVVTIKDTDNVLPVKEGPQLL